MHWRRIAFWSVSGLLLLLTLVVVWLWTADLGVFKPQIERWVSAKTGREFSIGGVLSIDLGRQSVVVAEDLRFQNAEWAGERDMLQVGRLEIRVDLPSLLKGPALVELVDVDDATIRLTERTDGDPNWAVRSDAAAPGKSENAGGPQLLFRQIDIERCRIVFDDPGRVRPVDVSIESLNQTLRPDGFLEVFLQAAAGHRRLSMHGEVGTWDALLNGRDVRYELDAELDTLKIESSGRIDDPGATRRPTLRFAATGPDIDDLTGLLGVGDEGTGNIDLLGTLAAQDDGPLVLDVRGNLGQTQIAVSGFVTDLQDLGEFDIDAQASGPDLGRILALFGIHRVRDAPFTVSVDAERSGALLTVEKAKLALGEATFDLTARVPSLPGVDGANINLDIHGPDIGRFRGLIGFPVAASGEFGAALVLNVGQNGDGLYQLDTFSSLGRLEGHGRLGPAPDYIGSDLEFRLTSDSLADLADAYDVENLPDLPDLPIDITGVVELAADGIRTKGPVVGKVHDVSALVDGRLALTRGLLGTDLSFDLTGPDLSALTAAFGADGGVPDDAYDIEGTVLIENDGYRFAAVSGTIGSSDVRLDGLIATAAGHSGSRIRLDAEGPAFEEVVDEIGGYNVSPGQYRLSGNLAVDSDLLRFESVELERPRGNVELDAELGLPLSRRWANVALRARGSDVRAILRGLENFTAFESPYSVDARGRLRQGNVSFERFDVGIGDARAQASGELEFDGDASATRFEFSGNIPSFANLGAVNGRTLRDQSLAWDARVMGADGVLQVEDFNAMLGGSDIGGSVRYTLGDIPELVVDVRSESIVFTPLMEEADRQYDPEPEFDDGRLIPDIEIPFDSMKKVNASIAVSVGEFERDALRLTDVAFRGELRNGVLDIPAAGFRARSGEFDARARIEPAAGAGKLSIEVMARDFGLGLAEPDGNRPMIGDIDINIESTGVDLRSLFGNANGVALVNTRGGKITNNRFFQALYGDLLDEILSAINPFYKAETETVLNCVVLPYEIVDGRLTSTPNSFISTDKVRIASKSEIDLKTEKLDMNIRTTPDRALGISAGEFVNPYIKVGGTLAAPRLAIDEKGLLVSGGAAVATGGLSILAKAAWDRLSRAGNPCDDTAEKAREALGDRFADFSAVTDDATR